MVWAESDVRRDTDETLAWQEQQDSEAIKHLRDLASFEEMLGRVQLLTETRHVDLPVFRGSSSFQLVDLTDDSQQPALVVSSGPGAPQRVLLDPNQLSRERGTPVSLAQVSPSPTGRYLMYALAEGGDERATIHVLDVETGTELPEHIPFVAASSGRWLADESGFWVATRHIDERSFSMSLRLHQLGATEAAPAENLPADAWFPQPFPSSDGRWVVAACGNTEVRAAYLRNPDGEWVPFLRDVPGGSSGTIVGDAWICVLDGEDPHGKLVRIPFATHHDRSTWLELVPAGDDVLRSVAGIGDELLVLGFLRDGACGLRVLRLDGSLVEEVALPAPGTIAAAPFTGSHPLMPMVNSDERGFSFLYSSFHCSPCAYRWDMVSGLQQIVPPEHVVDGLSIEVLWATSGDGTRVPSHVLRRADCGSGPRPALLHGYGGFNVARPPSYLVQAAAWVAAGGTFVLAHLRGGSEYGREWWAQGRMANKQNGFDDFYAVAEALVAEGMTTPSQLAIHGASNGGLLTGVAVTQRPELWAAVVSEVPVLDLLDVDGEPMSAAVIAREYGDPLDPEQREWLSAYSPVSNIRPDADYPPVLVVSGRNDPRCPPWHGRVFVQKLRGVSNSDALLRVPAGQGHGATERTALAEQRAEVLAFCAHHTGLGDSVPPAGLEGPPRLSDASPRKTTQS